MTNHFLKARLASQEYNNYELLILNYIIFLLIPYFVDNVCIESLSVKISRRTLDRSHTNVESLARTVKK